jgi:hypothetical protein
MPGIAFRTAAMTPVPARFTGGLRLEDVLITRMLTAASSTASPDAVSVVAALASVTSGLIAAATLVLAGPRYRLHYGMMSRPTGPGLWWVGIWLASYGRRDIIRDAFDDGRPIELDVGVDICELERVTNSQKSARIVKHWVEGTRLLVGPGLIGRKQFLRFEVQTEEKPTGLTCQASLIDVDIRHKRWIPKVRIYAITFLLATGINAVAGAAILVLQHYGIKVDVKIVFSITGAASAVIYALGSWRAQQR